MSPEDSTNLPSEKRATESATNSLLAFVDAILARPVAPLPAPEAEVQPFVCFYVGKDEFGLPIVRCREIVRVGEITRIPESPPHVRGVLNLRGRVLPVLETCVCLGLPIVPLTPRSRVIMVEAQGRPFGLLVDRVTRLAKLSIAMMKPAPAEMVSAYADKVIAVVHLGTASIALIDLDHLLLLNR